MKTLSIQIKVYNGKPQSNVIYILSRGSHSGKVLNQPCPNCYTIQSDESFLPVIRATAHVLYLSGSLSVLLRGSVIEFITVSDYRNAFLNLWHSLNSEKILQTASSLSALENHLAVIQKQQKLILQLIRATAFSALK